MKKDKRAIYFRKQRAMGIGMVLIAVLSALIDGNITAFILIAPIGLYTIFTKKMVLTNDYFFEQQEEQNIES